MIGRLVQWLAFCIGCAIFNYFFSSYKKTYITLKTNFGSLSVVNVMHSVLLFCYNVIKYQCISTPDNVNRIVLKQCISVV